MIIPEFPNQPLFDGGPETPSRPNYKRTRYNLKVITPLFGGGVNATEGKRVPDQITPIRGSSIRGQLRFWWRATSVFKNLAELKKKELELWGGISRAKPHPSQVQITIDQTGKYNPEKEIDKNELGIQYGAFPLRTDGNNNQFEPLYKFTGDFDLSIEYPKKNAEEIEDAITAWMYFGGLGGRTRRGFGAISKTTGVESHEIEAFHTKIKNKGAPLKGVSSLLGSRLCVRDTNSNNARKVLNEALYWLYRFRQYPRDLNTRSFGKSKWPEANQIRSWLGSKGQTQPLFAPRAVFGLPIIFHFKERIPDSTLTPKNKERRASPLILRPFLSTSKQYGALCLVLNDPSQLNEELCISSSKSDSKKVLPVTAKLPPSREVEEALSKILCGKKDILHAFLSFFEKQM